MIISVSQINVEEIFPAFRFSKITIGSYSMDDGDGSENVSFKMNSGFFKLCRASSSSLKMSNVGEFPWSSWDHTQVLKAKNIRFRLFYVLHKTLN